MDSFEEKRNKQTVKQLNAQITELDSHIIAEIQKREDVKKQLHQEQVRCRDFARRLKDSQMLEETLKLEIKKLLEDKDSNEVKLYKQQKQLQDLQCVFDNLQLDVDTMKEENANLVAEKANLTNQNKGMQENRIKSIDHITELESENKKLEEKVSALTSTNLQLTEDVAELQMYVEAQRHRSPNNSSLFSPNRSVGENMGVAVVELQLSEKIEEVNLLNEKIKQLESQLEAVQKELSSAEKSLETEKEQHNTTENSRKALELVVEQTNEKFRKAEEQLNELSSQQSRLQVDLTTKMEEFVDKCRELELLQERAHETEAQLSAVKDEEAALRTALETTNFELATCKTDIQEAMKNLGEKTRNLESAQNELIISSEKITELKEHISQINGTLNEKEYALVKTTKERDLSRKECTNLCQTITVMREKQVNLDAELTKTQTKLSETTEKLCSVTDKLQADEEETLKLQVEVANMGRSLAEEKALHEVLKQEYNSKAIELQSVVDNIKLLAEEKQSLETHSNDLERKLCELSWELETTRAEMGVQLTELETKRSSLESQVAQLENELETSQNDLQYTKNVLKNTQKTCDELIDKLSNMDDSNKALEESLIMYQTDFVRSNQKVKELEEYICTQESQLAECIITIKKIETAQEMWQKQIQSNLNILIEKENNLLKIVEEKNGLIVKKAKFLQEATKNIALLENQLSAQNTKLIEVSSALETALAENTNINAEISTINTKLCKYEQDLVASLEREVELSTSLSLNEESLSQCQAQLCEYKDELNTEIKKTNQLNTMLSMKQSELEALNKTLADTVSEKSLLQQSLDMRLTDINDLKITLESTKNNLLLVKHDLCDMEQQLEEKNIGITNYSEQLQLCTEQVNNLSADLVSKEAAIEQLQLQCTNLKCNLEEKSEIITELNRNLINRDLEISEKLKKIEEQNTKINECAEEIEKKSKKICNLEENKSNLETELCGKRSEITEISGKLLLLTEENTALCSALKKVDSELQEALLNISDCKQSIEEKTEEINQLMSNLSNKEIQVQEITSQLAVEKLQVSELTKVIAEQTLHMKEYSDLIKLKSEEMDTISSNLAEKEQELQLISEEYKGEKNSSETLKRIIADNKHELMMSQSKMETLIQEYTHQIQSKESQINSLNEELSISNSNIAKLKESIVEANNKIENLQTNLDKEINNNVELKTTLEIMDSDMTAVLSEKDEFIDKWKKVKVSLDSTTAALEASRINYTEVNEANSKLTESIQQKQDKFDELLNELTSCKQNLQIALEEKSELNNNIKNLESQLSKQISSVDESQSKISSLEEVLEKIKNDCCLMEAHKAYSELDLHKARAKIVQLQSQLASKEIIEQESANITLQLESEVRCLTAKIAVLDSKFAEQSEALANKEVELNEKSVQLDVANTRISDLLTKSTDFTEMQESNSKKHSEYQSKIKELTENLDNVTSVLVSKEHGLTSTKSQLLEVEAKLAKSNTQCDMYRHELEKEKTQIVQLKSTLAESRGHYQQLSSAHEVLVNEKRNYEKQIQDIDSALKAKYEKTLQGLKAKLSEAYHTDVQQLHDELTAYKGKQQKLMEHMLQYKQRCIDLTQQLNTQAASLKSEIAAKKFLEAKVADLERGSSFTKKMTQGPMQPPPVPQARSGHSTSSLPTWCGKNAVTTSGAIPKSHSAGNNTSNSSTGSTRPLLEGMGRMLTMEDEDGEEFNLKFLDDLRTGRGSVPNRSRISELQRRNTLCLPHLKSSYPVETQFIPSNDLPDDDLKTGVTLDENDCLLPGDKKQKDRGQTRYKKPGPPTPGKGSTKGVLDGPLTPRSALREQNSNLLSSGGSNVSRRTPSRLKLLFKGSRRTAPGHDSSIVSIDENTPITPRGRRLSFFRK